MSPSPEMQVLPTTQVKRIEGGGLFEAIIEARPSSTRDDLAGQFASLVTNAKQALLAQGMGPSNVVAGWLHLSEKPTWSWRELLASAWDAVGTLPLTAVVQPPAQPFVRCSMHLQAMRTPRQSGVWHGNSPNPAAATVLRSGARHLRLMSVVPRPEVRGSVADRAYDMFAQAGHALTDRGLSFADVIHTWIYARDVGQSYTALEQARHRYFRDHRLDRLPAGSCGEGTLADGSPLAMDLYAVASHPDVRVPAVSFPGSQEASAPAAFARARLVEEPARRTLFVSGTASIDSRGEIVAVGDLEGQLECMFGNVGAVLDAAAMRFADVVAVKVHLKHAEAYPAFALAAQARGLGNDVPTTVVALADLGRPEWLCEIALWAVQVI